MEGLLNWPTQHRSRGPKGSGGPRVKGSVRSDCKHFNHKATLLPQWHARTWMMIGWGQTCRDASLPTKMRLEFMALLFPWKTKKTCSRKFWISPDLQNGRLGLHYVKGLGKVMVTVDKKSWTVRKFCSPAWKSHYTSIRPPDLHILTFCLTTWGTDCSLNWHWTLTEKKS